MGKTAARIGELKGLRGRTQGLSGKGLGRTVATGSLTFSGLCRKRRVPGSIRRNSRTKRASVVTFRSSSNPIFTGRATWRRWLPPIRGTLITDGGGRSAYSEPQPRMLSLDRPMPTAIARRRGPKPPPAGRDVDSGLDGGRAVTRWTSIRTSICTGDGTGWPTTGPS